MKKILSMAVCSLLTVSMLAGCGVADNRVSAKAEKGQEKQEAVRKIEEKPELVANVDASADFDKALIDFVDKSGFGDENYMVSPTSFRAALALAVAGADTETKDELIHAMGFNSMDEVNEWYNSVSQLIADFNADIDADAKEFKEHKDWYPEDAEAPTGSLIMMNSIWNNTDLHGKFGKDYKKYVEKNYGVEAYDVNSGNITDKVNKWVDKGTNGLIPKISDDLSNVNAALINTLYLKSSWVNSFSDYATAPDNFTTSTGETVRKDFMNNQDSLRYYEDSKGRLVVLPLNGGVNAVFVLGEIENIHDALSKASYEDVILKLPKFEIESSFDQNEFIYYLMGRGATTAFSDNADFSVMCPDTAWMITDIIQKTRISVDEEGLEAAAATAILMCEAATAIEEYKPKEFIADQPFKFYICGGENDSEVLFCGQVVK